MFQINLKISLHKDKSVEISEHKSKKIICLMFHPEEKKSKKKLLKILNLSLNEINFWQQVKVQEYLKILIKINVS